MSKLTINITLLHVLWDAGMLRWCMRRRTMLLNGLIYRSLFHNYTRKLNVYARWFNVITNYNIGDSGETWEGCWDDRHLIHCWIGTGQGGYILPIRMEHGEVVGWWLFDTLLNIIGGTCSTLPPVHVQSKDFKNQWEANVCSHLALYVIDLYCFVFFVARDVWAQTIIFLLFSFLTNVKHYHMKHWTVF